MDSSPAASQQPNGDPPPTSDQPQPVPQPQLVAPTQPVQSIKGESTEPTHSSCPSCPSCSPSCSPCLCLCYPRFKPGQRKPIVYVFSPTETTLSITLSLTHPELRFSAVYPIVPIKRSDGKSAIIEWNVRTLPNGNLVEVGTGLEVSYLFWETEIDRTTPLSPPRSPVSGQPPPVDHFSPASWDLHDSDSVLLPVSQVTVYLQNALHALGLHAEARTSFITFWLPSFLLHKYVALRFISQSAFERSAPMNVLPTPDVVTRVFMLFKGVQEEYVEAEWSNALACAKEDVRRWQSVVGVDFDRASDQQLYRVLEWGGMEVSQSPK